MNFPKGAGIRMTVAGLASVPLLAVAQDADRGGLTVTLDVSQSVEASTNRDFVIDPQDTSLLSNTGFELGIASRRRAEQLSARIGGDLLYGSFGDADSGDGGDGGNGEDSGLNDPFAAIDYARQGANSRLSFAARYTERDVSDFVFDPDQSFDAVDAVDEDIVDLDDLLELEEDDLVFSDGTRASTDLRFDLRTGIDDPVSFRLTGASNAVTYRDIESDALNDRTTDSLRAEIGFRLSPTTTARVTAGTVRRGEDGETGTDRDTTSFGVGLGYDISPILRFNGSVGLTEIDGSDADGDFSESGTSADLGLSQQRPNGTIDYGFSSDIDENGRRTSVSLGRALDLRRGDIDVSLGVSDSDQTDPALTSRIRYNHPLRDGAISAGLSRVARSQDDGDEVLSTRIDVDYLYRINSVSRLSTSFDLARSEELETGEQTTATDLGLGYSRDLTRDWALNTGLRYRVSEQDPGETRDDVRLSLGVSRTFTFRP